MSDERPRPVDRRAAARMAAAEDAAPEDAPAPAVAVPEDAAAEPSAPDELAEALARAERFEASWKRAAADLANYRRRVERERAEQQRLARAALVLGILPVHDDFARAAETLDDALAGNGWVRGVLAIQRKLAALLESMGVEEIPAAGEPFDPSRHEAVARAPGPDNVCLDVAQRGYSLDGGLIRPALVVVGDGEAPDAPADADA